MKIKFVNIPKLLIENIDSLQQSKTLILMRGLPGAGKSTLIKNKYPNAIICSADHHFINPETQEYIFNPAEIANAHQACMNKAVNAIKQNAPLIVIDNTNTQKWEFQKYVDLAKSNGYEVKVENVFDGGLSDEDLAKRNTHRVPLQGIQRMRSRWEE